MCLPLAAVPAALAISSLVVGAGTAAISYVGQQSQASAQATYQSQLSAQQRQQYINQANSERSQQAQQQEALNRDSAKVAQEAREARARATVAAGEAGVTGLSVDALLGDFSRQESSYLESNLRQEQFLSANKEDQLKALQQGAQFSLTQINQPISRPSPFALALGITGAGVNAGASYYNTRITSPSARITGR